MLPAERDGDDPSHDPGDAVPPGVAPKYPPPLTPHDREVKSKLDQLGDASGPPDDGEGGARGRPETSGPETPGR